MAALDVEVSKIVSSQSVSGNENFDDIASLAAASQSVDSHMHTCTYSSYIQTSTYIYMRVCVRAYRAT